MAKRPRHQHVTWKRVTTGRPGSTYFGPMRLTAIAYAAKSEATSSQTSRWKCQPGRWKTACASITASPEVGSVGSREAVEARQDDQVQDHRREQTHDEEPPEDRLVGAEMHVPAHDERELDDRHHQQQRDDQAVGKVALGIAERDLDAGDGDQHHCNEHVLERRGVRPYFAGQESRRRCPHTRRERLPDPFEGATRLLGFRLAHEPFLVVPFAIYLPGWGTR